MKLRVCLLLSIFFGLAVKPVFSQESTPKWDNQLFIGNKASWALKQKWRVSGELQTRLKNDFKSLDRWFLEGQVNFLATRNWEFTLPLRYSIRSDENEFRPGLGFLYKMYGGEKFQVAHQVMWQVDIDPREGKHGLRYVAFLNYLANEKLIPNLAAGLFYRWQDDFTGLQFIRVGGGLTYVIDVKHTLNFSYFVGITDTGEEWVYQGIPFLQLVININRDFRYLPAKYINF